MNIPLQRLYHQRLVHTDLTTPAEVVSWLGAVQSQDYAGAKWAIGLRLTQGNDASVEDAFNRGEILRTHVLRPTWHFVTPADIRWMLMLTAPRVQALNKPYYRQVGLDEAQLQRSVEVMAGALQGGKHLTREALAEALHGAGIETKGALRYPYILMNAELEGVICSGARQGKHHTYALMEERVPPTSTLTRDDALAVLLRRYLISRGPVTLKDFVRWSGLTMADVKAGIGLLQSDVREEVIEGQSYWYYVGVIPVDPTLPVAQWLPNYDEYLYGYTDGFSAIDGKALEEAYSRNFTHGIVVNGKIVGVWRRTLKAKSIELETASLAQLTDTERPAVAAAAQRLGDFLGLRVVMKE